MTRSPHLLNSAPAPRRRSSEFSCTASPQNVPFLCSFYIGTKSEDLYYMIVRFFHQQMQMRVQELCVPFRSGYYMQASTFCVHSTLSRPHFVELHWVCCCCCCCCCCKQDKRWLETLCHCDREMMIIAT